ncbi:MAG: hypothetical protein AAGJ86_08270 [Pseudomonadota bacterium]
MRYLILLTLMFGFLAGCGAPSAEEQIRALISSLAEAAEDEAIGPFRRALHDDYQDLRDNDKAAVITMLRGVMLQTNDALILTDVESIDFLSGELAEVAIKARFAGADWDRLRLRGAVYRFELDLVREDDDWRITSARWARGDDLPR